MKKQSNITTALNDESQKEEESTNFLPLYTELESEIIPNILDSISFDFTIIQETEIKDGLKTIITDKYKYIGHTKEGKQHGLGVEIYNNGDCFIGYFDNGCRKGFGKLKKSNKETLIAEFDGTKINGFFEHIKGNTIKTGYIKNESYEFVVNKEELIVEASLILKDNIKRYFGKIVSPMKIYEGELNSTLIPDGWGQLIIKDKLTYKGVHQNGKINGYGETYFFDNTKTMGIYSNNKKNGPSIYFFKDAKISFANYINGLRHGPCILSNKNVLRTEIWNNGFRSKVLDKFDNTTKAYFKTYYPEFEWIQKFNFKALADYYSEVKDEELKRFIIIKPNSELTNKNENKTINDLKVSEIEENSLSSVFEETNKIKEPKPSKVESKLEGQKLEPN